MKQNKSSSLDQKADARYAEPLHSGDSSTTVILAAWEGLPVRKSAAQTTRFIFTPTATSEWSAIAHTPTSKAGWSGPTTIPQTFPCVCGTAGSS